MPRKTFWNDCLLHLEGELSSNHFNTWIRPLQAEKEHNKLYLLAPNRFVKDWVDSHYLNRITEIAGSIGKGDLEVILRSAVMTFQNSDKLRKKILAEKFRLRPAEKKFVRNFPQH